MNSYIQIIEKPDWVSWESIHDVIWRAHEQNREKGIVMRNPSLEGDEIRQRIEGKGKMFVALDGSIPIGTAAYLVKNASLWCGKGRYGYFCFAALLPSYRKKGIYPKLCEIREEELVKEGIRRIMMDTHEDNKRELTLAKRQGFIPVDLVVGKDHSNVLLVKWLEGRPYPPFLCWIIFMFKKCLKKAFHKLRKIVR